MDGTLASRSDNKISRTATILQLVFYRTDDIQIQKQAFNAYTVESLEFVAQFLWCSWVALPHEFKSSTKTILERVIFGAETVTDASTKLHPHESAKKS